MKAEDDVVSMLQLFSDYINNAYRNTTVVDKFRFKLISTDNNVVAIQNELQKLSDLFKLTEARSLKMLYLSKPQGNARAGSESANALPSDWPIYREYIEFGGSLSTLGVSTITIPNPEDGDKFFINFTNDDETSNTGVYVFNKSRNELQLDPMGTSQDPFNATVNEPSFTDVGLAPRILEFNISDVGDVGARRAGREGTVTYYEVFFDATIYNINDITGIETKTINNNGTGNQDFDYVIDYYATLANIPSSYEFKYDIEFADACHDMDWSYSDATGAVTNPGFSLFYARDLTNIDQPNTLVNREGRNIHNDPIFDLNTSGNDITEIVGTGVDITITTRHRHSLSENDEISIQGTINFNGNYVISKVLDYNKFRIIDTVTGNETVGKVITRNLFYSKSIDNPTEFDLVVPYIGLDGNREFAENDTIVRVVNDIHPLSTDFSATHVNIITNEVTVSSLDGFPVVPSAESLKVTIRGNGTGTLPTGLVEGILYDMFILDSVNRIVSFSGVDITAVGTGEFSIYYEGDGRRYFDASADVNLADNEITLNNITNNINTIAVGDNVHFRYVSPNIALPVPLESLKPYQISEVNTVNNTIKLEGIDLTALGTGICDISVVIPSNTDSGKVDKIQIDIGITSIQDGQGSVSLKSYTGDMITTGYLGRYENNTLKAFAQVNTTAIPWSGNVIYDPTVIGGEPERYPMYPENTLVTFDGVQYMVLNTVQITENSKVPPSDTLNYRRHMDPIITRPQSIVYNPYMFGLYKSQMQLVDENIDYTQSYSVLGQQMYIQQIEDLALRYGYDQREWLFNPRFAPQSNVVRNGFIDFVQNVNEVYDPVDNNKAVLSISKANTADENSLFGVNVPIRRTIDSITTVSGIATATTVGNHGYKNGSIITISGSSLPETNGSFIISVIDGDTFTYGVSGVASQVATGLLEATYQVNVGDFINVISQTDPAYNGIYVVQVGAWTLYDDTSLQSPSIIFCKENLFSVGKLNPPTAKGELITLNTVNYIGSGVVQVSTSEPHGYTVGTTIEIRDAVQVDYNGRFEVEFVTDELNFQYHIGDELTPSTPADGIITCQDDAWYQYRADEIQWQKISNLDETDFVNVDGSAPVLIPSDDGNNNVDLISGVYAFTLSNGDVVDFTEGLVIELADQLISIENGIYRVRDGGTWIRLDTKLSMKIRDMRVNAYDNPDYVGIELDEEEVVYRTFSNAETDAYINDNSSSSQLVYRVTYPYAQAYQFLYEKVDEIDTAGSIDRQYNAKNDYNSVVNTSDMSADFEGIPDMDYPLVEKIERIAYNKDPRAIDLQLIQYLARYMGYDATDWANDIVQSPYYSTTEEAESAIRRAIEQLPQYYTLKSTESGLELLLLMFGIVGELVSMWTPQNSPYSEFIPDYKIRGRQYADMLDGIQSSYVPTPHFAINVNIAGNFENQILQGDQQRVVSAINRFKPINTVFDGIRQYIQATLKARITISGMNAKGKQSCSIGYENVDWSGDLIDNDCL
jgi:hypothetical protein